MSTKIYNAYKFNGSMGQLVKRLEEIRELHRETELGRCALAIEGLTDKGKALLADGVLYEEVFRANGHRSCRDDKPPMFAPFELDTRGSAVIYFKPRRLYVQFFTNHVVMRHIDRDKRFKDWHYQNQVDMPDDVSAKEWYARKMFWEKIFEKHSSPSDVGLIREFSDFHLVHDLYEKMYAKLWPEKWAAHLEREKAQGVSRV